MACKTNVCPNSSREDLLKAIVYSHEKGYLLTSKDSSAFASVYIIPELNEKYTQEIPEVEIGEIAYVNFAISEERNSFVLLKMLRDYMKSKPQIKELVYFRRNTNTDFKRIHLRRTSHE
jgi:hypothetical protein